MSKAARGLVTAFLSMIALAAVTAACAKHKSAQTKAECESLIDVASTAPGAVRGAAGGSLSVYADRFERVRQQIAAVPIADPKLSQLQTKYVDILQKAIDVAHDPSTTEVSFRAWLETLRVQEDGVRAQVVGYCSKP